ncbi:MAG TPA: SCO family protein [Bacteroidia bacterium]|nr:SCO family protein [Bacteroidia bacterium]
MSSPVWKKIAIPFAILLFPVVFWLVLITGKNHFKALPIYGPIQISEQGDTTFHSVGSFRFQNQEGTWVSDTDIGSKLIVANFFFATCKTVCPDMNAQMSRLQSKLDGDRNIQLISFTVDPESDSVPVLFDYAKKMGADNSRWWFLTGDKDSIYAIAREGFLVSAAAGKTADDFFHSQDLILLDSKRRIRAIVDGTNYAEVDSLFDQIKLLHFEEERAK